MAPQFTDSSSAGFGIMMKLPALSVSTKLYGLFALLAALTVALAVTAVLNARRHAGLADDFQAAFMGAHRDRSSSQAPSLRRTRMRGGNDGNGTAQTQSG